MDKNKYFCLYTPKVTLERYTEKVNRRPLQVGKERDGGHSV